MEPRRAPCKFVPRPTNYGPDQIPVTGFGVAETARLAENFT